MLAVRSQDIKEGINYPMATLRKVVNLAFTGVPDLDEMETPYRLVDEMLDHHRKEVIKFSLEIDSYYKDAELYFQRLNKGNQKIVKYPCKDQSSAVEVISMQLNEYTESVDNVLVLGETMTKYEMGEYVPEESRV